MFHKLDRNLWGVLVAGMLAAPAAQALTDDVAVQLLERLNELEGEVSTLRGENEQLRDKLQGVSTRQEELDRLRKEAQQAAETTAPPVVIPTPDSAPTATVLPGDGFKQVIEEVPALSADDPLADIPPLESVPVLDIDKPVVTPADSDNLANKAEDNATNEGRQEAATPDGTAATIPATPPVPPLVEETVKDLPPVAGEEASPAVQLTNTPDKPDEVEKVDPHSPDSYYYYGTGETDKKETTGEAGAAGSKSTADKQADAATPAAAVPVAANVPDEQKAKAEYNQAYKLLVNDPSAAAPVFRAFLQTYPNHQLAANAQYWLAESLYAQKDFQGASSEFMKVLKQHKDSPKAPGAALKLGYSFYELQQWDYARRTLEDTVKFFPDSNAAKLAQDRLQRMSKEGH